MSAETFNAILLETIDGCQPCKAYSGMIAAIETFNGTPVIVMAKDMATLVEVMREMNPKLKEVDRSLLLPGSFIHDRYVIRKDGDL